MSNKILSTEKFCEIKDVDKLHNLLVESGDYSCEKCCARSKDASTLCHPMHDPKGEENIFCD